MASIEEMKQTLSRLILMEIKKEFDLKHLSGNLARTIKVAFRNGNVYIEIPAEKYNMALYKRTGTIVYTGKGSYASKIDRYGSKYHHHKGYIDNAVNVAIQKWKNYYGIEININE